jgi:hypothetical protein
VKDRFYEELERVFDKFHKSHIKILLGDFIAKVGREDIFKPTFGNESLHKISNANGVIVVNFTIFEKLTVRSTMFLHRNIHKFTWTSPDEKADNQIYHILIDRRRHSSVSDVLSFRATDCDTDHYLVVTEVRDRLAVSKQTMHRFHMEKFSLKKLNEIEGTEQYWVEISNKFAGWGSLGTEVDINRAWETVRENTKISAKESIGCYELKKHNP